MSRIYDSSNTRSGRRDYNRSRPADDYGAFLRAMDEVALAAGDNLRLPPSSPFVRPAGKHGRLTFNPFAKLDPSQIMDLRHRVARRG